MISTQQHRTASSQKPYDPWWYKVDLNMMALSLLVGWLALWVVWATLPVIAGAQPWLMDLTSSGYKLDAFHVALEQIKVKREPFSSVEEFQTTYARHAGALTVPLQVARVAHNEQANALEFNLRPIPVLHSQGTRAIPLAAWREDKFEHFVRQYFVVLSDREPMRAACYHMPLPIDRQQRVALMRDAQVRYYFSVSPEVATRFESVAPTPESDHGVTQGVMLGVIINKVALVGPSGEVIWSHEVDKTLQQANELEC